MPTPLSIRRIDKRRPAREEISQLRACLAPEGNVVSEAGRKKTIEVFGAPLTPIQVVERICSDVREQGIDAVLKYTAQLEGPANSRPTARTGQRTPIRAPGGGS